MDENFRGSFKNLLNSGNTEENATSQNSLNRPDIQFTAPTQYPSNFPNVSYAPQYPPNFQSSQNLSTYPNNVPQPPFYMYPPEYWRFMGSQFPMPAPPLAFPALQPSVILSNESKNTDASDKNQEPATPSSIPDSQFPYFSPHTGLDNIVLDKDNETKNVSNVNDGKRAPWSVEEDKLLASSWVTISTDPIVGNDQKDRAFWKRITNYYNEHRPAGSKEIDWKRAKSHFYLFHPLVSEFSSTYNNLYNNRPSGWSDEDILVKAHEMWKANHNNKHFKYEHVWRVLRECEKYAPQHHHANKKARTSESGGHTTSSNSDSSFHVDDCEVRTRPMGQKAAKRKGKSKAIDVEKWEERMDYRWQKMEELHIQNMELQKTKVATREAEALHKDYEILMKDTNDMTPEQIYIHLKICEKLKRKHGVE